MFILIELVVSPQELNKYMFPYNQNYHRKSDTELHKYNSYYQSKLCAKHLMNYFTAISTMQIIITILHYLHNVQHQAILNYN